MRVAAGWCVGLFASVVVAGEPAKELERHEATRILMGAPVTLTVYAPGEEAANTAFRAAFGRIQELNALLSDYDSESALMRLCATAKPGEPVKAAPELCFVLSRSEDLSRRSEGAFDVTVGPVVQLWRKARRAKRLPDEAALRDALSRVGWRNVVVDRESETVELRRPGMRLDLGGIAKGYAADEALRALKTAGVERALVAVAGDIVAGDPPPGKSGWRIGVAPFGDSDAAPDTFVELANAAVSTSGDAFQFVEVGGVRYSHIVDPATGLGLTRRVATTVLAPDGITADSVATAVCVLGTERGLKLVESTERCDALVIESGSDGKRRTRHTPGWTKRTTTESP